MIRALIAVFFALWFGVALASMPAPVKPEYPQSTHVACLPWQGSCGELRDV